MWWWCDAAVWLKGEHTPCMETPNKIKQSVNSLSYPSLVVLFTIMITSKQGRHRDTRDRGVATQVLLTETYVHVSNKLSSPFTAPATMSASQVMEEMQMEQRMQASQQKRKNWGIALKIGGIVVVVGIVALIVYFVFSSSEHSSDSSKNSSEEVSGSGSIKKMSGSDSSGGSGGGGLFAHRVREVDATPDAYDATA